MFEKQCVSLWGKTAINVFAKWQLAMDVKKNEWGRKIYFKYYLLVVNYFVTLPAKVKK